MNIYYECFNCKKLIPGNPKSEFNITINIPEYKKGSWHSSDNIEILHCSKKCYNTGKQYFEKFTGEKFN